MRRGPSGTYEITSFNDEQVRAFVPDPLPPEPKINIAPMYQQMEAAAVALGNLDAESRMLPDPDLFLYLYIRREALLSSQIEGTQSSLSDLFVYEFDSNKAEAPKQLDVTEVSNYIAALEHGIDLLDGRAPEGPLPVCNRLIRATHSVLLRSGRGSDKLPGQFRRSQNWIGGNRPGNAAYVPPPHAQVEDCMGDLERFINADGDGLPAIVRAGLAHAQFETIHPFLDGNGRLGRLLISFILREAGLLARPVLYISLHLKRERDRYYDLLGQIRVNGDWEAWLEFFIEGVRVTAEDGIRTARRLTETFERDRARIEQAGRRAGSALRAHEALKQRPTLSIARIAEQTGLSIPAASSAVALLLQLGIVREMTGRRRGRVFGYAEYIDILSEGAEPL